MGFRPLSAMRLANFTSIRHMRRKTTLDALLLKVKAGSDEFVSEKYHDQIAPILAKWGAAQLRPALSSYSKVLTADFQITRIEASPGAVHTRVLYEIVGSGRDFFREQRTGFWDIEWELDPSAAYRVRTWRASEEHQNRSAQPWYSDITAHALGSNSCYGAQLLHGADYWRTVLDGACGIDIYGHNGVSVGDIDGDGFDDLYICQPAGLPNRLFLNRGDGTFEDVTERSGIGLLEDTACALIADFTNNGRQDLLVVRSNGPLLFLNEGNGRFRQMPDAFKFATAPQGTFTGAAAADYNRDGYLDVYFCLYIYYQGAEQYKYPAPYYAAENGPPNFLMRNNGDATFSDVTAASGLNQNNTRYSFCCGWDDFNGDGWPDLYVVNDFGRKNLYRNNGDGTFTDIAEQAGVDDVGAGMSVAWFDYNNDGFNDLYVGNMWTAAGERISAQESFQKQSPEAIRALYRKHAMGNSLFENTDGKKFRDVTASARVGRGRWAWSSDAWDYDHDGNPDLYIVNGMISGPQREDLNSFFWRQVVANSPASEKPSTAYEQGWTAINELIRSDYSWSGYERNVLFANNGDGTFSDVSGVIGLDFTEDGRAFALSDFDHDGRQELFLKNRNAPQLRILKNVVETLPASIIFCLQGTKSNRDAIGAVVTLETESKRQTRTLQAGSGFLSQHSKEVFFGVGHDRGPVRASIRWPSGLIQQFNNLPLNHRIRILEGTDTPTLEPFRTVQPAPSTRQQSETLPTQVETWLLAPIPAPCNLVKQGKPALLTFHTSESPSYQEDLSSLNRFNKQMQVVAVDFDSDQTNAEVAGVYSILFRYVFNRHRDLPLPTSFLINEEGEIVKIYQGRVTPETIARDVQRIPRNDAERLARALPFAGPNGKFEFGRNHLSFGSIYFQRGFLEQAQASFLLALHDDPASAEANYGLGSVYLKQDKVEQAREHFQKAVESKASYPDTLANAWNNLGLISARQSNTEVAIGYFQKSLEISPEYAIALLNLGNAYRTIHRWDKAEEALARAVSLRPDDPESNYGLAMVFAQTDRSDGAFEYLQKALRLRPEYPEALNNLGVLYLRTKQVDQAIETFQKCINAAPHFDQAYLNLARVYALQGETVKARAVLTEALKQEPNDLQVKQMLADLK